MYWKYGACTSELGLGLSAEGHGAQHWNGYVEGTTGAKLPTSQSELEPAPLEVHVAVISVSSASCCSITRKVPG